MLGESPDLTSPANRQKPNLTYSAAVGSVDLAAEGYEIWPCTHCLPWHVDIVRDDDGELVAREWHAVDCPIFQELIDAQPPS